MKLTRFIFSRRLEVIVTPLWSDKYLQVLFQFEGTLYEQFDGVAMGSPLLPLIANVFMCSIEEQLQ